MVDIRQCLTLGAALFGPPLPTLSMRTGLGHDSAPSQWALIYAAFTCLAFGGMSLWDQKMPIFSWLPIQVRASLSWVL